MEREKEQWIDKAMNSLDGLTSAVPPANMQRNIMQRIQAERFRIAADAVHAGTIYRIAAGILIIVTINVFTCVTITKNISKEKQLQGFAKQYSLSDAGEGLINI